MLLLKSNKKTPGTRHKIFLKKVLFFKKKIYKITSLNKNKLLRRVNFYKNQSLNIIKLKITTMPFVFKNYFFKVNKLQEFGIYKNVFNYEFIGLITSFCYPGLKYYPLHYIILNNLVRKLIGQPIPLYLIPINFFISNVNNGLNIKSTYSKSLGSYSIRQKITKKNKLIHIKLPSNKIKKLPSNTLAYLGVINSHLKEKCIDGKWGWSTKLFKKINVRGVAKNPVDHPNGGRTKAKQPEKSPWGWVAKLNK